MSQNPSKSSQSPSETTTQPKPDSALKRLEKLLGTWDLNGRTLNVETDNIFGQVTIDWLPGGFFMQQRGWIDFMGFRGESLEIISYDPVTRIFPATVYSSMSGLPLAYYWDVQGNLVTHWTDGAKYTGTFNEDGTILTGGWRPMEGAKANAASAYDAIMVRTNY
jgi:hypothetical protein